MKKINLLIINTLLFTTGLGIVSCGGNVETDKPGQDNKPDSITLIAPKNLMVSRVEDKWTVTFDSVENATKYLLDIELDNEILVDDVEINSGYTLDPLNEDGTYHFNLIAASTDEKYTNSEVSTFDYSVENYENKVINGVKFTGRNEQGKPLGEFSLTYPDGSIYLGTLNEDYTRKNGKLTYTNKMYYEGEFVNDNFEGKGKFTWSTTGNSEEGNTYVGEFKNGGFNDCVGTYTTAANFHRTPTYGGIYNFTGVMGPTFGECGKVGTIGQGEFQFPNDSIYTGDLLVTAPWQFLRQGKGSNIWIVKQKADWINGGSAEVYIHGFIGEFDSKDHAWIYGDGIWYFKDANDNPVSYIKGKWDGGNRIGEATSELTVLPEWKDAKEITL